MKTLRRSQRDNIVAGIICGYFLDIGRTTANERSQIMDGCAVRRQLERQRHEIISDKS